MYRTPDNSDIPEWDGVEAEVADLEKTELRESMGRHPAGKSVLEGHNFDGLGHTSPADTCRCNKAWDEAVDRELKIAEDAHLDAAYEERFEPLEMGEWYEEPWYEEE